MVNSLGTPSSEHAERVVDSMQAGPSFGKQQAPRGEAVGAGVAIVGAKVGADVITVGGGVGHTVDEQRDPKPPKDALHDCSSVSRHCPDT